MIKTKVFSSRMSNFHMLIKILFDVTRKITHKTAERFFARMNSNVVLNVGRSGHNFWAIWASPSSISYTDWLLLLKFQSKSNFNLKVKVRKCKFNLIVTVRNLLTKLILEWILHQMFCTDMLVKVELDIASKFAKMTFVRFFSSMNQNVSSNIST